MKDHQAASQRKCWNNQHAQLRRLLVQAQNLPRAIELFRVHHAMVHTAQLQANAPYSFQDEILQTLTEDQMRYLAAEGRNSVVWMLWHVTRIEDAALNVLAANKPQLFHQGNWQRKLNSSYVDVGNEMTAAEIRRLSETVNIKALLAYRLAVGKRTQQVVGQLTAEGLKTKPLPERLQQLLDDGTVRAQAQWLLAYWGGHPQWNLLLMPGSRHSFVHFNEMERMLPTLRRWVKA